MKRYGIDSSYSTDHAYTIEKIIKLTLSQSQTVFTGGEDGVVRAWRAEEARSESRESSETPSKSSRAKDKKPKEKERFKPY